jgi:uncharacterized protein YfaS (alpha-2-macroglobulin family)
MYTKLNKNQLVRPGARCCGHMLLLLFQVIFLLAWTLILGACKSATPEPTPTPTPLPPTPIWESSVEPTPTLQDSVLAVVDDGSPLPLRVVERYPTSGQELSLSGEVVLKFNQAMEPTKTTASWRMVGPEGSDVPGKITWPDPFTLQFKADEKLAVEASYRAILSESAESAEGVSLAEPFELQFSTVGELQVSQTFPVDGTTEVSSDAVITAIFNRPVVPLVIAEERDQLPNPLEISPAVSGEGEWVSTSVFAFRPDKPLRGGTTYWVTIKAGLSDALQETQLGEDYSWLFSTIAPSLQSFELKSGRRSPEDGIKDILLDEAFIIYFNQPMDEANTDAAISLTPQGGSPVSLKTEWNEESTKVTISPVRRMALQTRYTLNLDASAQSTDGNSLDEGLTWTFTTIPPPSVLYISPPEGNRRDSFYSELMIKFASPMMIDSVKERVVITPEPEGEIEWWYNDYYWSISAYVLEPSTSYVVRALPGMSDIYGNTTTEEYVVRFTTQAASPQAGLQMPYQPSIMREGGPQQFYITYRNVNTVEVKLYSVTPSQFASFLNGDLRQEEFQPQAENLVWETLEISSGELNERVLKPFQPTTADGNPLPAGFYFITLDTPDISHPWQTFLSTRLLVVADVNLTFKSTTNEALIWVTDLQSGEPLSGVPLTVYDDSFRKVANGLSDVNGLLKLDVPTPANPYDERFVMTDKGQFFAFATSMWGSGVSQYDYGLWTSYYAPGNQPKAYVYTDRPIYRPGQEVYFKGVLRLDDDLAYSIPSDEMVHVKIENFKEMIYEADLPLTSYGSFDGEIILDPEAVLGYYSITVQLPGEEEESIGSVGFTVAEYHKPEFQVQVSAAPTDVLDGEEYTVTIAADYYSGGNVVEALVEWTLNSQPYTFVPEDQYSGYSFTDYERDLGYYEDFSQYRSEIVAEGEGYTDGDGELVLTLPADLSEFKTSRQFTFEATITDLSKNAVSGRTDITVHKSALYPGVHPSAYVGRSGSEQSFDIVLLDWDSNPISDHEVSVEIVERRWHSVQEQDASGTVRWKSSVEEIPVISDEVTTDGDGKASISFTPQNGGIYKARVSALDEQGNEGYSSAYIWVAGRDYIPWRQTNDRSFDLVTDRTSYNPGDTAEILIASPFQGDSYALITIERGHIYQHEVLHLTSNSTVYKLPITSDLAPNVYISVVVVKGIDETNPRPNFKMGVIELKVDTREQEIFVTITSDEPQASPGEKVGYTVKTFDKNGDPVDAELSLGLSDLATLSLTSPNSLPIIDFFYNRRTLGVWTSVPIVMSLEDYNVTISDFEEEGQGMGSGGGKGEGDFGVMDVRQDFPDTAFWNAHVKTGSDGEVRVMVTLPDNLTTWRMDARAVTLDTMVGQAEYDLISTRPLLVRPQTPRFFVVGDQVRLGAAIHNNTEQNLTVQVELFTQGVSLVSDAVHTLELKANRQTYVTWDVRVEEDAERVDLVFNAEGVASGGESFQDASRPPLGTLEGQGLPVYRYEARETVGTSGLMTSAGTRLEAVSLPSTMTSTEGTLTIQIAPSLAAGMTDGLTYLEHFPYECVEQTISRFLPNVISTRALKSAGLSAPELEANLETQVNTALQRLVNWQNPDGGWGWWSNVNQESDVLTSAYVVLGLLEAEEAGYTVNQRVLDSGIQYLWDQVVYVKSLEASWVLNRQSFVLYVLARADAPNVSAAVQLFEQRQNMAIYARAFLAQTFQLIDEGDPRIKTLLSDFASLAITSATGTHWEEGEHDYYNWNTDTRTTAIVLSTLSLLDTSNPLNANAVRWLMSHRVDGHWRGTQETAWTLMGLTRWMEASGELLADYQYAVAFNGERLGGGIADETTLRRTLLLQVDIANMLRDEANRLAIARDEGPGNLYYTTHMELSLPVDQVSALDQGMIVTRSYYLYESSDTDMSNAEPVTEAELGDLLLVRLTLVAPSALHYVILEDPLPAGLEAVDQSLETSPENLRIPRAYNWEDVFTRGWGWWRFENTQLRDEKVVLSASYLPAGTYIYTYLVRAGTAGTFSVIPPTAHEFYFPEVYGRGEGATFVVQP